MQKSCCFEKLLLETNTREGFRHEHLASFLSDTVFGPSNVSEVIPDLPQFRRACRWFLLQPEKGLRCALWLRAEDAITPPLFFMGQRGILGQR